MRMNTISVITDKYHPLRTQARQKQTEIANKCCRQMPSTLHIGGYDIYNYDKIWSASDTYKLQTEVSNFFNCKKKIIDADMLIDVLETCRISTRVLSECHLCLK